MSSGWSALADAQLVLAGFALLLAAQQASVWHWEGSRSHARLMVFTSLATAAVFISNDAVLRALDAGRYVDGLLFARSLSLGGLAYLTLPLAGTVIGRPPPRWLTLSVVAIIGVRLMLWPSTDLVYRHAVSEGVPSYGPVMAPTGLAIIVLVFGYLCLSAGRGPSDRERMMLSVGLVVSLVLAVFTVASGQLAAEVLSGYVPFPALVSIVALLWTRQLNAFRTVRRLAERQHTLAELGRFALTADLAAVVAAADQALAAAAESADEPEHDEYVAAVGTVVAAAYGQDQVNDELRRRATTDDLTGLANRSALTELINRTLAGDAAVPSTLAVALCDIDRFRSVNDAHGHSAGDDVLRELARRLTSVAQNCDVVARLGGDEFVVVCTGANGGEDVDDFGRRLTAAFAQPVVTANVDASVTASIGIVTATTGGWSAADAETLLRDADTAMYDAKARGGGGIGQFHDGLRTAVVYRADLERRLIGAVDRGEIVVHYQPILSLPDRRIVGFEALARWQQGSEMLPPDQWIPLAESTGLIEEIGAHVLCTAVDQLKTWLADGHDISVSVNVSPRQLSSRRFPAVVRRCLATGVPPELLGLEVTESLAVDEHATGVLTDLRRAGVRIALDDFGTGYSALSAVSRLPIDILKIDSSIIRRVNERDGQAVVSAVLAIASSLGLRSVAEGVETRAQEARLILLGCELVQGYLYSRPVPAAAARELLLVSAR